MAPRKLSDDDKQAILELYRQPGETTSTLAKRYGVSNTTISRILKNSFSDEEYETLIQQKRIAGKSASDKPEEPAPVATVVSEATEILAATVAIADPPQSDDLPKPKPEWSKPIPKRRTRSHSEAEQFSASEIAIPSELQDSQLLLLDENFSPAEPLEQVNIASELEQAFKGEELLEAEEADFAAGEDGDWDDDEDDDDDLEGFDEDDDEDDDGLDLGQIPVRRQTAVVKVLPLSEASLPKPCYLVVDRAAELITRPLKEFAHLGQIPEAEVMERTLPVFDNHRVARRFSRKNQRVVKVPDGKMLEKTSEYLSAKGITRILVDGQVYSLLN